MKPLILIFTTMFAFVTVGAYASCKRTNTDTCYYDSHRKQYIRMNYQHPVIFCEYQEDRNGKPYRVCHDCNKKRCVKDYFFDNYCNVDPS